MNNLVTVSRLSKRFGEIQAVRDLDFTVAKGEVLGFLGPNGAGKSTTMKMITGFLEPDTGEVEVAGHALSKHPVRVKQSIGYLPEGSPLYGDMTTLAFLQFIGSMRGLSGDALRRRVDEVIDLVNLGSVVHQDLETLSKGFKRRVGIAQAVLHDPPVLILDEPTDGLDPNQKHEVRGLIRAMAPSKAIILSTHILEEVEAVCSRAMIIAAGAIVADNTPVELAARAAGEGVWMIEPVDPAHVHRLGESFRAEPWVSQVETGDFGGADAIRVTTDGAADSPAKLRRLLQQGEFEIAQIYRERGRLDDVFRDITGGARAMS